VKYQQPYGVSDPNAAYINGNPSTGTMGSIPPAASIEFPQREIVNLISDAQIMPVDGDLRQLSKAIQSGKLIYADDAGVVNQLALNCVPPVAVLQKGMVFITKAATANLGPVTATVNGITAPVVRSSDLTSLLPFDINVGQMIALAFDGTHFQLVWSANAAVSGTGAGGALTANFDIYINGTTGDDTNYDGSQATVGTGKHGPFKTIQHGIDAASKLNANGYLITIHVADGNYNADAVAGAGAVAFVGNVTNGGLWMVGNPANPGACVLSTNKYTACVAVRGTGVNLFIKGFKIINTTPAPGNYSVTSQVNSSLVFQDIEFGVAPTAHLLCDTGMISCSGNYTISGSTYHHVIAQFASFILTPSNYNTVTFGGGVSLYSDFAYVTGIGFLRANARTNFVGGFSGPRFTVNLNGVIDTGGLGVNWFPGTGAGAASLGGQYN
jgi:hypothetical protein